MNYIKICIYFDLAMSDIADVANIIIAIATLLLGYYIFVYQRRKDKEDKAEAEEKDQENKLENLRLQEQNIRIQWFKELIIQPHLSHVNGFYESLYTLESRIIQSSLNEDDKQELNSFIKQKLSFLRKTFVDVLIGIDRKLYDDIIKNLDNLIDSITNAIFNENLDLTDKSTFEKEINSKISYSRNDLIKNIYNYKGV